MGQMVLNNDPIQAHEKNQFADSKVVYFWGDNTVNLFSLGLSPMNWMAEYLNLSPDEVSSVMRLC
jgi:hypothetical protein